MRLRAALPRVKAPNRTGWKVTTNSVAESRFGQQKVSSRGDAITDCRQRGKERERKREKGKKEMGYRVRRKRKRKAEEMTESMTQLWEKSRG